MHEFSPLFAQWIGADLHRQEDFREVQLLGVVLNTEETRFKKCVPASVTSNIDQVSHLLRSGLNDTKSYAWNS